MTTKNTKMILFASLASLLLIPFGGMVNATTAELPQEIKQEINDRVPVHLQSNVEEIFSLVKQKYDAGDNESEIERFDQLIALEKAKMDKAMIDNKQTYRDTDKLREVQTEIESEDDIPVSFTLVTKNTLNIVLDPSEENKGWEKRILDLVTDKTLDVKVGYGTVEYKNLGCSARDAECDPLQGGLRIEDDGGAGCTLGLPVKQGTTTGYLTAGHCFGEEDIFQPEEHWLWGWKIGTINSGDDIDNNDCDCAFITDSNSRTNNSEVWMESWYSTDITGTEVPNDNDSVTISGAANDWWYEDVEDNDFTDPNGLDLILLSDSGTADHGDSGAPVYDWANDNLIGTVKGIAEVTIGGTTTDYLAVIPWASISHSTDGLGVSLL